MAHEIPEDLRSLHDRAMAHSNGWARECAFLIERISALTAERDAALRKMIEPVSVPEWRLFNRSHWGSDEVNRFLKARAQSVSPTEAS